MIRYNNVSVSITEDNVRKFRTSVAVLLLMSMVLSACSKEKVEETEPSASSSAVAVVGSYDYLVDEAITPVVDAEYIIYCPDYDDPNYESSCVIPVDAYNYVIASILDFIDDRAMDVDTTDYIGMDSSSGLEKFISDGKTKDDLAVGFIDITGDGIAEMFIVAMDDEIGHPILELYSYNEDYGIRSLIHGDDQHKYYLLNYMEIYCESTEPGKEYLATFYVDYNLCLEFGMAYRIINKDGVDHLWETWSEGDLTSDPTPNSATFDLGSMNDTWNAEEYRSARDQYRNSLYRFQTLTLLSEYTI